MKRRAGMKENKRVSRNSVIWKSKQNVVRCTTTYRVKKEQEEERNDNVESSHMRISMPRSLVKILLVHKSIQVSLLNDTEQI